MPTVGTLTVNLEANTAAFTSDLGKAGDGLQELGKKSKEASEEMDFSMREARGSLMLVSEEVGVHIPRHLQALIAAIPGVGEAFATMLPLVGVFAAIAVLAELITKAAEAKEKLAEGFAKMDLAAQEAFNHVDDQMLRVSIRADELAGNHLAALREKLLQIDRATLNEIADQFKKLAGAADETFKNLETHWYSMHVGSEGAKHALAEFQTQYQSLLASGKDQAASDLLKGTLDSAQKSLAAMESAGFVAKGLGEVSKQGVAAQRAWVDTLQYQLTLQQKIKDVGEGDKQNDKTDERIHSLEQLMKAYDHVLEMEKRDAEEVKKLATENTEITAATAREETRWIDQTVAARHKATEEAKRNTEEYIAGVKQSAQEELTMDKLLIAAAEEKARMQAVMTGKGSGSQAEIEGINAITNAELAALDKQIAALDASDAKQLQIIQEFENKKKQLIQQSDNQITQIRDQAAEKQYQDINRAETQIANSIAQNMAKGILEGKNLAKSFEKMGAEMIESALTHVLELETIDGRMRLSDAKTAAANAYKSASAIPVVGPVLAPVWAAAAFAGVMAFEAGGEIPGSGPVPIIAHGGETVVTRALTEQVKNGGAGGRGGHTIAPVYHINAIDSEGMAAALQKHEAVFVAHLHSVLRKYNR